MKKYWPWWGYALIALASILVMSWFVGVWWIPAELVILYQGMKIGILLRRDGRVHEPDSGRWGTVTEFSDHTKVIGGPYSSLEFARMAERVSKAQAPHANTYLFRMPTETTEPLDSIGQ